MFEVRGSSHWVVFQLTGLFVALLVIASYVGVDAYANTPSASHSSPQLRSDAMRTCSTRYLKFAIASATGAEGIGEYYFTVRNISENVCDLRGFFHVSVFAIHRNLLTNKDKHVLSTPSGKRVSNRSLVLRPSKLATLTVAVGENPVNGATACPVISTFGLTPPHTNESVSVSRARKGTGWFCQPKESEVTVYATAIGPPDLS